MSLSLISLFLSLSILAHTSQSTVPASKTFKFVNEGEFGLDTVEYGGNYRALPINTFPFQLCFYNTSPNTYMVGLRMGGSAGGIMRWVWDANRGNPVREKATLTFGTDGNLVLADANKRVAWQTGTSNKGVVGLKLLPNGNIVLHDSRGKYVWQSFDNPRDTLLVGQRLRLGNKLVSRVSDADASEGPYRVVLEQRGLASYLVSKNSPKPLLYNLNYLFESGDDQPSIVFNTAQSFPYSMKYDLYKGENSSGSSLIGRPKYNSTLTMLRVESDGRFVAYTYSDKLDEGAWDITYKLFDNRGTYGVSECKLPTRCGALGVCENGECIACPTPKGLLGWSTDCALPTLQPCKAGAKNGSYYKVVGVDHFSGEYTEGRQMKLSECRRKCNDDCGCLGFFYRQESSRCFLAPELGTLTKVIDNTHVAYIKMSK